MTRSTHPGNRRLTRLGCVVLVTLILVTTPAVAQPADSAASIEAVAYTGDGSVDRPDTGLLIWQSASHRFTVTVSTRSNVDAEVCLSAGATGQVLGCERASLPANATERVTVGLQEWPANLTGETTLEVALRGPNSSAPVDEQTLAVTVLRRDGDLDDDGLTSQREVSLGTDPRSADTDGDGLDDSLEVVTYDSSPVNPDSDGDGLDDGAEIRTHLTDPIKADSDGDGLWDGRELELETSPHNSDSDGDTLTDAAEVNTYGTNATTADTDGDGLDDGTELDTYQTNPRDSDTDGDGISDALEVITYGTDPGDPDTDSDGLTDGAEVAEYRTEPATADTDRDGLSDGAEVNRYGTNPLNADTDGDGLSDGAEVNRYGTNALAIDTDGDGTSDRFEVQTGLFPDMPRDGPVAAGLALLLAVATAGFYATTGRLPGGRVVQSLTARVRGAAGALATRGGSPESEPEPSTDAEESTAADASQAVPVKAISNEDRVLQVLAAHDGQVRQSEIVDETGWSKAKVSRVLSKMEDDGQVTKISIGRENVVTRPEDVPEAATPSFESSPESA